MVARKDFAGIAVIVSLLVFVAAIVVPLTNAGAPPQSAAQESASVDIIDAEITITNEDAIPSSISVPQGGTVQWTNQDSAAHVLEFDQRAGIATNPTLEPGQSFTYNFIQTGEYTYKVAGQENSHTLTVR